MKRYREAAQDYQRAVDYACDRMEMVPGIQIYKTMRDEWLKKLTSKKLYIWEYLLFYRKGRPRTPVVCNKILQEEAQFLHGQCEGVFAEVQVDWNIKSKNFKRIFAPGLVHWIHYVKSRLFWDPYLDMDALTGEYYRLFYGPAEKEMKEFYEFAEKVWTRPESRSISLVNGYFKEKDVDRYFDILARARKKAGANSVYDRRIALIEEEMQPLKKIFPNLVRTGPDIRMYPVKGNVVLDGKLDDESWNYIDRPRKMLEIVTGEPVPSFKSSDVYIRYDEKGKALYVGVKCNENKMDKITATAKVNDDWGIFNDDVIEVYIETPERSYFKIVVNTEGKVFDESTDSTILERDTQSILWNPDIKAAVHKGKDYFSVEIRIPTDDFGELGPRKPYPWGINVCRMRFAGGQPEAYVISPTGKMAFAVMSKLANIFIK